MFQETRGVVRAVVGGQATVLGARAWLAYEVSVWSETGRPASVAAARVAFAKAPAVVLMDEPARKSYPMPLFAAGKDPVYVGRIRRDLTADNGLAFWCVSDQIKKGAALTAVQILGTRL